MNASLDEIDSSLPPPVSSPCTRSPVALTPKRTFGENRTNHSKPLLGKDACGASPVQGAQASPALCRSDFPQAPNSPPAVDCRSSTPLSRPSRASSGQSSTKRTRSPEAGATYANEHRDDLGDPSGSCVSDFGLSLYRYSLLVAAQDVHRAMLATTVDAACNDILLLTTDESSSLEDEANFLLQMKELPLESPIHHPT